MGWEYSEQLYKYIKQIYPLPEEELNALIQGWKTLTVKRKTLLTAAGETEKYLYFVLEGVQRAFYLTNDNPRSNNCIYLCSIIQRGSR